MKTDMREALVYCSPTKMQANSSANRLPASSPARPVPSARNKARPRDRDHSTSNSAAPRERAAACMSGGISLSVTLAAT